MSYEKLNISGVDVFNRGCYKFSVYKDYDIFSLISAFLNFLGDTEWLSEIILVRRMFQFFLTFCIKTGSDVEKIEHAMGANIVRLRKHLEDIGLKADYIIQNVEDIIMARQLIATSITINFRLRWVKCGDEECRDEK